MAGFYSAVDILLVYTAGKAIISGMRQTTSNAQIERN